MENLLEVEVDGELTEMTIEDPINFALKEAIGVREMAGSTSDEEIRGKKLRIVVSVVE